MGRFESGGAMGKCLLSDPIRVNDLRWLWMGSRKNGSAVLGGKKLNHEGHEVHKGRTRLGFIGFFPS
jgi:hypothetical protein